MLAITSRFRDRLSIFRSLKVRIFIILVLFGMIPVGVYSGISVRLFLNNAISQRVSELQSHASIISNLVVNSNFFTSDDLTDLNTELNQVADVYKGRILIIDNNLKIVRDTYTLEDNKTIISKEIIESFKGRSNIYINNDGQYVEITMPINNPENHDIIGAIFMSFSTENIFYLYDTRRHESIVFIIVFFVVLLALAFICVKYLFMPFKELTASIMHIANGDVTLDSDYKGYTELESIADSYTGMLEELKKTEESRQEFVSNVSHELKTPITSIKVLAESLTMQEDAPAELYKEFMVDICDEIERVNNIINDLLTVVKTDRGVSTIIVSSVNINEFIEKLLKTLRPIAAQRNIELVYESFRPITAEIDETKLGMAINNLIENAIKYNMDDGWVRVSLNADHKYFYVKVADSGVGIPEELQERIFERFYRVDKARSRETGGTGLGLAITRNVILMHRGAIKVYSKEGEGSLFTVRIPLNFQA